MRAVVTRVKSASVTIEGQIHGAIDAGLLVLLGIKTEDEAEQAVKLADKICGLRVFQDDQGQMNLSLGDVGGKLLVISQFTLYGNCKKGRRPEFLSAARPETAIPLYERFILECKSRGFQVETGQFGASMQVASVNDGPVTLILDTETL
ncbi:MAG: D-aminoacyl-tRNA deacylase [Oscillospiraceae bacterium]|nr:D-aminoacyl-tRNA deacylase [Oscillospiraceae bacterium]